MYLGTLPSLSLVNNIWCAIGNPVMVIVNRVVSVYDEFVIAVVCSIWSIE